MPLNPAKCVWLLRLDAVAAAHTIAQVSPCLQLIEAYECVALFCRYDSASYLDATCIPHNAFEKENYQEPVTLNTPMPAMKSIGKEAFFEMETPLVVDASSWTRLARIGASAFRNLESEASSVSFSGSYNELEAIEENVSLHAKTCCLLYPALHCTVNHCTAFVCTFLVCHSAS